LERLALLLVLISDLAHQWMTPFMTTDKAAGDRKLLSVNDQLIM